MSLKVVSKVNNLTAVWISIICVGVCSVKLVGLPFWKVKKIQPYFTIITNLFHQNLGICWLNANNCNNQISFWEIHTTVPKKITDLSITIQLTSSSCPRSQNYYSSWCVCVYNHQISRSWIRWRCGNVILHRNNPRRSNVYCWGRWNCSGMFIFYPFITLLSAIPFLMLYCPLLLSLSPHIICNHTFTDLYGSMVIHFRRFHKRPGNNVQQFPSLRIVSTGLHGWVFFWWW